MRSQAVPGKIDGDGLAALIGQQVEPAGPPPVVLGGRSKPMDKHNRNARCVGPGGRGHKPAVSSAVAFSMSDWYFSST
jgi:hypothetical protein